MAKDAVALGADAATGTPDGRTPTSDTAVPPEDAGPVRSDLAVIATDAGSPPADAAESAPDAAPPEPDAAASTPDAAPPERDAAVSTPDAAPPERDAAVPTPDAAPPEPDAGPCDDPRMGEPCFEPGICGEGVFTCDPTGPVVMCSVAPGGPDSPAGAEVCNGLDDDCDGLVDGAAADAGTVCEIGLGLCRREGRTRCVEGAQQCDAVLVAPSPEVCNALDDDCDGLVDGPAADAGDDCADGLGECRRTGVVRCVDGGQRCDAAAALAGVETCNGLDDDCDGEVDEDAGCLCNPGDTLPCYDGPDGTEGIGLCTGGLRFCNPDRQGFGECEGQVLPAAEACDGVDDDCDGTADDGFDFLRDAENCGGCGVRCDSEGGIGACLEAQCALVRCEDGRYDQDLDASNGCEGVYAPAAVYVGAGGDAEPDGTGLDPYPTAAAALAARGVGADVVFLPGDYTEAVSVAADRVTLRAAVPGTVTLTAPPNSPAITFTGPHGRIRDLLVRAPNSPTGVTMSGPGQEVTGLVVEHVNEAGNLTSGLGLHIVGAVARVSDTRVTTVRGRPGNSAAGGADIAGRSAVGLVVDGAAALLLRVSATDVVAGAGARNTNLDSIHGAGGSANGVVVRNAPDARAHGLSVGTVTAGAGCCGAGDAARHSGGPGGIALGAVLMDAPRAWVTGLSVSRITGGAAGVSGANGGNAFAGNYAGRAEGLSLTRTDEALIGHATISTITGGTGGAGAFASNWQRQSAGGTGGHAVGVSLVTANEVAFTDVAVDGLRAGAGGSPGLGVAGVPYGFVIDPASRGVGIDRASRVHGDAVHYYDGVADVVIADETLDAPVWPTSWGKITLRSVSGAIIERTTVSDLLGGGARIRSIPAQTVGLFIDDATTGVRVTESVFTGLTGGPPGPYSNPAEAPDERGGDAHAIVAEGHAADTLVLSGNEFSEIIAGAAPAGARVATGDAIVVDSARSVLADHNILHTVSGASAWGYALRAPAATGDFDLETHADFAGVTQEAAIRVLTGGLDRARLTNAIVSGVQHVMRGDDPLPARAGRLVHQWVLVHDSAEPAVVNAAVGESVIIADPAFSFFPVPYSLQAASPAVDAGDPGADCDLEPVDPDGPCHVDLGHLGNTPRGRAAAGR